MLALVWLLGFMIWFVACGFGGFTVLFEVALDFEFVGGCLAICWVLVFLWLRVVYAFLPVGIDFGAGVYYSGFG